MLARVETASKGAPEPAPEAALEVAGLSHRFGGRAALDGVSFRVDPGDFTVLLGPNGAGKTTLFAVAAGLHHPGAGTVRVFGHDMRAQPRAGLARMGAVFQQPTLDLDLSVQQNLEYHAALHGMAMRAARPRIEAELGRIGLLDRRRDRVRALSGGQRRRVELARALVHHPALLLMDEPTVGLDAASRRFLLAHVRGLCRDRDLAVLWATHLLDEAEAEGTKVVVLHKGRVRAAGLAADVAGTEGLPAAFRRLTSEGGDGDGAAPPEATAAGGAQPLQHASPRDGAAAMAGPAA